MKPLTPESEIKRMIEKVERTGCRVHLSKGDNYCILGLVGDIAGVNISNFESEDSVEKVLRVTDPYKLANRVFHPDDTVIKVRGSTIGGKSITVIAGPCSVESEDQLMTIAREVKRLGATFLRGGAYKPRTSPYSFQGLGEEGLKLLAKAREETGLPIVTEVVSTSLVELVASYADVLQIGARNMQNFELLKEVGRCGKPVLLKRGMSATVEDLLMAAEYVMSSGNPNVVLCERGIRTFENFTRNTLDISAIPALKRLSHLPVIVDPSHASGRWWMIEPLSKAAIAVGADGITVEVHNDPANALSDGEQSIKFKHFGTMMESIRKIAAVDGRTV